MGDKSRKMDVEELTDYGNKLIDFLKEEKDIMGLNHFLRQSKALKFQCAKDFNAVRKTIQDYKEKINLNKLSTSAAESECIADAELDLLQKELEEKQQLEQMLRDELRAIVNEIDDLECRQVSFEEQRQTTRKLEQDELRAQMKLSMYASITNIIPCLDDESKISGHIVEGKNKMVNKIEFDRAKLTAFETCGSLWNIKASDST